MPNRILIADDEEGIRMVLRETLRREGLEVVEAENGVEAVEAARRESFSLAILDLKMPGLDGIEVLQRIRQIDPLTQIVMVTAHGGRKTAMEAIRLGAYDYFEKPFEMQELRVVVKRALERREMQRQIDELQERLREDKKFSNIIGLSRPMQAVFDIVRRVMAADVTVIITGESGTGKELIAEAIHYNGPRSGRPLLKVNCAAIPLALLESELFGHERGSFTGAIRMKPGKFEQADGGTIFLDEIGELPLELQSKILRVLQEREIERVGSTQTIPVDVRVIAATNKNLALEVQEGRFREDLFFRLNVVPIQIPALRERREDIPLLVEHFTRQYREKLKKTTNGFTAEAMDLLQDYAWPGNVREMENVIQRAIILSPGPLLGPETLPPEIRDRIGGARPAAADAGVFCEVEFTDFSASMAEKVERIVDVVEKRLIEEALKKARGRRQESADLLGISRKSLHNKMIKHKLF